jgi:hypothetical protein
MRFRTSLGAAVVIIGAAIGTVLCITGPALAAPAAQVPPDVSAVLAGDALQALPDPIVDGGRTLHAEAAHPVFRFTHGFLDGLHVDVSVVPTGDWLASVTRGNIVLGSIRVAKPDGRAAEVAGFEPDVDFGAALRDLDAGEVLVEDTGTGGYFALDGSTVRPLNDWAQLSIAGPADLSQLQQILASDRATERQRTADAATRQFWLRIAGVVGVTTLLLAFGSVLIRLRLQASRTRALRSESQLPG